MHINDEIFESRVTGTDIFRRSIRPKEGEIKGVFLMLHGWGDHQGCHIQPAELLAESGFASVGVDWPGNGSSEGIRGDMPGVQAAIDLIEELLDFAIELYPDLPIGLYSHSTGGFLVLRYLAFREENPFRWFWLSSPLLHPGYDKSPFMVKAAPILASFLPKFTVSTGVTQEKIRHIDPSNPNPGTHRIEGRHHRMSLRVAADFLLHAPDIHDACSILADPVRVLITQGSSDEICPPEYARELFENIATSNKDYALIHGLRHELFREPANAEFLEVVSDWITDL